MRMLTQERQLHLTPALTLPIRVSTQKSLNTTGIGAAAMQAWKTCTTLACSNNGFVQTVMLDTLPW